MTFVHCFFNLGACGSCSIQALKLNTYFKTATSQALFEGSMINPGGSPHLRASVAAASAATSAAATAAAAALFKVASNLWMAEASAVGPLLLPEGDNFTTCSSQTLRTKAVQLQTGRQSCLKNVPKTNL